VEEQVNFVTSNSFISYLSKTPVFFNSLLIILLSTRWARSGEQLCLPSAVQLAEFNNADSIRPFVDQTGLVRTKSGQDVTRASLYHKPQVHRWA